MKIQFVGTGSGKTSLKRFHSSLLITSAEYNLLIDCGDGISKALLFNNISYNSINGILITHLHPDHYSGLAALLIQMKINNRSSGMDIYIHESNLEYLQRFIYNSYIFIERLGFELKFISFEEDRKWEINNSLKLTAKQNSHLAAYKEFDTKNELGFSCISLLLEDDNVTVFYTGDIGDKEDLFLFKDKKIDIFISEMSHVEIEDILNAFRMQKISKLYLTHISDVDEIKIHEIFKLIPNGEKDKIFLTFDGLKIQ